MRLKNALRTLKKGGTTINEYIGNMEDVYDVLMANGQSISENELINFIIDGSGSGNDVVVAYITSKLDSPKEKISLIETRFVMQKYKQRLNQKTTICSFILSGGATYLATQTRPLALGN